MSAEYTNNHYVPQWYQRQFIPAGQADRELYLLDLKPERFRDGNGVRRRRKALRRTGTRHCFAIDDLYTTRLGGIESRELERVFFGEVDSRGKRAVEFFARFDHDRMQEDALQDLMRYMSTQKLRTPKGLDWLVRESGAKRRGDVLDLLHDVQMLYGAIWSECAWQIADADQSEIHRLRPPRHGLQPVMHAGKPPLVQGSRRPRHPPARDPHAGSAVKRAAVDPHQPLVGL